MFKKLTVRSRTRIILWWTLVLSVTLIFLSLIGDQSSTAQKGAVTQTQPSDKLVVRTSSGSVVSSAPGALNPQTDAGLRVLLEKYPGTERAASAFSETLPVPTRVVASEISNMLLSWSGNLSFSAQSDTHDFNIGLLRKKSLRIALWEAGLGQV